MSTAETAFLVILVIGLAFLIGSFVFGEAGDFFGDFGTDHGSHGSDTSADGPELYDIKVIAAGLVGLGASGYAALQFDASALAAAAVSLIGFVGIAAVAFFGVLKPLSKQQSNTLLSRQSYVGVTVKVVIDIEPGGYGEVEFRDLNGSTVRQRATSSDDKLLPKGSRVLVYDVNTSGLQVTEDPNNPIELQ